MMQLGTSSRGKSVSGKQNSGGQKVGGQGSLVPMSTMLPVTRMWWKAGREKRCQKRMGFAFIRYQETIESALICLSPPPKPKLKQGVRYATRGKKMYAGHFKVKFEGTSTHCANSTSEIKMSSSLHYTFATPLVWKHYPKSQAPCFSSTLEVPFCKRNL